MASLEYREDMDQVRDRLTRWWHGGDIGRPVMCVTAERVPPDPKAPPRQHPPEYVYVTGSTANFDYRVELAQSDCAKKWYLGEAMPTTSLYFGTNALATYFGCRGVERPDAFWVEPNITDPDKARFEVDPSNFYWQFTLRLARKLREVGKGKFLIEYPDLTAAGLDALAAMRGNETFLTDLLDRPEWVRSCMRQITDRFFYFYDVLYDLVRDEVGGSFCWLWGPGRTNTLQCDCSAMLSPEMFGEFMTPVLAEMSERVSYNIYHLDGVPQHQDRILSFPRIQVVQWSPPAGGPTASTMHKQWWPLYHKTIDAGKRVLLNGGGSGGSTEELRALKREFGHKLNNFAIGMYSWYLREAQEWMDVVQS
jgi:hypothetical protein